MNELLRVPVLAISLVQGLFLYFLYHAEDRNSWPSESPMWSFPLWTIAVIVPLLLLLSIDRRNYKSAAKHVAIFGVIIAVLATYIGYQAEPYGAFRIGNLAFSFACGIALASFKALMYLQQRADGVSLSYPVLFTNSWRNFLVAALSALFVVVFGFILILWGQLFNVIGIEFFSELFQKDWFLWPVLSVAFGVGVIIFRGLQSIIDSITRLFHWLLKLLLPLVIGIGVIFIAALPIVGLDSLWETGNGTALLLWLLAIALFFVNAVYQDGRESNPYPLIVHRLIYVGLCVLPIISALSLYGLTLRLQQYGWTVQRCWAFIAWFVFTLFAVGYFVGIVRRRDNWTHGLSQVNTAMGIVVLILMLLLNSPLLDFRKISLNSQMQRIESGEIELKEFDFWYARNSLARPGHLAVEKIKDDIGDSDPGLLEMIEQPHRHRLGVTAVDKTAFWEALQYRPERFEIPDGVRSFIDAGIAQQTAYSQHENAAVVLVRIDMDEDGTDEYALITDMNNGYAYGQYFFQFEDTWRTGHLRADYNSTAGEASSKIRDGEILLVEQRFKNIEIGGLILKVDQ